MHLKSIVLGKVRMYKAYEVYKIHTRIVKYICNIKVHM